jgi:hypothetical protein
MVWKNIKTEDPPRKEKQQVLDYVARKAKARFYADEGFPAHAVAILREMGARVETVQEASQTGHPDENNAAYALKKGLVLLSCDRDFLDDKKHPLNQCPAVFVFDFGRGSADEMKQAFQCMGCVFSAPQFFDKWCKVDAKRDSWTERMRYQNGRTSRARYRFWQGELQEWFDD